MHLRSVLRSGLFVIAALAPLPLGSNRDWAWGPLAAIVGLELLLLPFVLGHAEDTTRRSMRALAVPAGAARWGSAAATAIGLSGIVALVPTGQAVLSRLLCLVERGESERIDLPEPTLQAISLRPRFGWELNSFREMYSVFQPTSLERNFDKAHNT